MTSLPTVANRDYARMERTLWFLHENADAHPSLSEIARVAGLSPYHFQRVFARWVGVSPKRFLQFLTKEHAKVLLANASVLDAALGAGLSGPGRLHDLFVQCEAITPGEYKDAGRGLRIDYGFHATPFGEMLVAVTARGICRLAFVQDGRAQLLTDLRQSWPGAKLSSDPAATRAPIDALFAHTRRDRPLSVLLRGTNFQIQVWQALLDVPAGAAVSYETLARNIGRPQATRAVASAVAQNALALVIPCHRVIRKIGECGGYRWGPDRKRLLLAWESARRA